MNLVETSWVTLTPRERIEDHFRRLSALMRTWESEVLDVLNEPLNTLVGEDGVDVMEERLEEFLEKHHLVLREVISKVREKLLAMDCF